ncbi:MAG: hypothetical protein NC489_33965, partial [Ruminococcus flavefaciens]|nr:hypothetical protein [Ruminococcus flavefaciens]
ELHNVQWSSAMPTPQRAMTPEQMMQELQRRKQAAQEAAVRAIAEKAERDKKLLHETLSEEAQFSITYVPYVIAEVAWDYADSILDYATLMRLRETKPLCREIRNLRREYDRERFKIINDKWRASETENMIMFQETLSDFFGGIQKYVVEHLTAKYGEIEYHTRLLVGASYACRIVMTALQRYCAAQEKIVTSILGYSIGNTLYPKELKRLYVLVKEFAGDTTLDKADFAKYEQEQATELAKYIADTEINDEDKQQNNSQTTKTEMTMEEMTSLVAEINATIAAFQKDAELNVNKGNKAAGTRARKASLKLEKLMKTYRKNSVK